MILTLPDHDERRRIINKMHRTKDKDLCRRLNAILLLADGHSVSAVSRLTAAARSSINRWVNWYVMSTLELLKIMLDCGHTDMQTINGLVEYLKYFSDLPANFQTDYQRLFGAQQP
jgi:hypothetical protein